jgi:hypothetical protein
VRSVLMCLRAWWLSRIKPGHDPCPPVRKLEGSVVQSRHFRQLPCSTQPAQSHSALSTPETALRKPSGWRPERNARLRRRWRRGRFSSWRRRQRSREAAAGSRRAEASTSTPTQMALAWMSLRSPCAQVSQIDRQIDGWMHSYRFVSLYLYPCLAISVNYIYIYVYIYKVIYAYMFICMKICTYIYRYTYIHTCIYIYLNI